MCCPVNIFVHLKFPLCLMQKLRFQDHLGLLGIFYQDSLKVWEKSESLNFIEKFFNKKYFCFARRKFEISIILFPAIYHLNQEMLDFIISKNIISFHNKFLLLIIIPSNAPHMWYFESYINFVVSHWKLLYRVLLFLIQESWLLSLKQLIICHF